MADCTASNGNFVNSNSKDSLNTYRVEGLLWVLSVDNLLNALEVLSELPLLLRRAHDSVIVPRPILLEGSDFGWKLV